ncbi:unnamed protein product [Blepharisma stoltei]|uniref:Protein kinase domain-containing protein n=1 Tax=Blepharisma stoltei TaxID=1481888 RepID=A0AAU9K2T8_9CILI|nr:unnamed protein product [Blepharisma stoltei]
MNPSKTEKILVNFSGKSIYINKRYSNLKDAYYTGISESYTAYDNISDREVKILAIENALDWNGRIKGTLNEINLMKHFQHENILQLYDIDFYEHNDSLTLYLITESMDTSLDAVIRSSQDLTDLHIKFIIYQILRALVYIHSAGVILGNLSPKVVGINANCDVKITDFWFAFANNENYWYEDHIYDVDRLFLAPECLNIARFITTKSDIWSVGCIMAYFLKRQNPLFNPENSLKQINSMFELLGFPAEDDLLFINNEEALSSLFKTSAKPDKTPFKVIFPEADSLAIDFLEKMLVFNPLKRWDAEKLLKHEYLKDFYEPKNDNTTAMVFEFDYHDRWTKTKVLKEKLNRIIGRDAS